MPTSKGNIRTLCGLWLLVNCYVTTKTSVAWAYPDEDMGTHWSDNTLTFNIHPTEFGDGSTRFTSMLNAISSWWLVNVPGTSLIVNYERVVASPTNIFDGHNTIGYGSLGSAILGQTTSRKKLIPNNEWAETDIVLKNSETWADNAASADAIPPYSNINIEGVARHEAGHAVGFFSHEDRGPRVAVMNSEYSFGSASDWWMHGDDLNGLRVLYPASGLSDDVQAIGWKILSTYGGTARPVSSPSPAAVASGNTVTIEFTLENLGNTGVLGIQLGYYLSTNTTISATDVLLATESVDFQQASGGNSLVPIATYQRTVTIPSSTPSGTYYLGVIIDYDARLTEVRESNNTLVLPYPQSPTAITVVCPTPGTPAFVGPIDGAICQMQSVCLSWVGVAGATYDVQIGTSCGTSTVVSQASTSYCPPSLLAGTIYHWRVRAVNICGNPSPWSTCRSFTTSPATPGIVTLVSPTNGTQCREIPTSFAWLSVPNAVDYEIQIGTACNSGLSLSTGNMTSTVVSGLDPSPSTSAIKGV